MWTSPSDAPEFATTDTTSCGPSEEPALVCAEAAFDQAFHYWRGASGRRYLHSVYSLVGCPALPQANFILVRRHEDGSREALAFGNTKDGAMSLNLADTARARTFVEADLTAAHLHQPAAAA